MSPATFLRWLWALVFLGLVGRLALAFSTTGVGFDIHSVATVGAELTGPRPLEVYDSVNEGASGIEGENLLRWPYLPGFFPWAMFSTFVEHRTALPFHGLVQLPAIFCDLVLALLVQAYLGWVGAAGRTRLLAAGAVALGPIFIAISGYHGQIDSVAILPAVLALVVWEGHGPGLVRSLPGRRLRGLADRMPSGEDPVLSRATVAGALIGLAVAIKTPPILMLFALAPLARSVREASRLIAWAVAIPLVLLLPFLIADADGVAKIVDYRGAPGLGGIGLAIQPELAEVWLTRSGTLDFSAASQFLFDWGSRSLALILLALSAFVLRFQPTPLRAAVLLWLGFYAFTPNLFAQYLVWGMPFFLMAGYLRATIALQLVVIGPLVVHYLEPWKDPDISYAYVPPMLAVWIGFVAAVVLSVRAIARSDRPASQQERPIPEAAPGQ